MVEQLSKTDGMHSSLLHGKDGTLIAWVEYTDDFYDDIYQGPDYGDIEQQDIDLKTDGER